MWLERIEKIIFLIFAISAMAVIGMRISYDYKPAKVSVDRQEKEDILYTVKLTGEVENPGTYTVRKGSRICDVIYAGGGITHRADLENMKPDALIISDTEINVPSDESVPDVIPAVNINKADTDTLMLIPGIGESTAQNIVDYRKTNGSFSNSEELLKVDGIGQKKFDKIKKYIATEDIKE